MRMMWSRASGVQKFLLACVALAIYTHLVVRYVQVPTYLHPAATQQFVQNTNPGCNMSETEQTFLQTKYSGFNPSKVVTGHPPGSFPLAIPEGKCIEQKTLLVIGVTSVWRKTRRRSDVREAYLRLRSLHQDVRDKTVLKFFVGELTGAELEAFNIENEQYGDLVMNIHQGPDEDTAYEPGVVNRLTTKVYEMIRYFDYYYDFHYFMRLGDDAYAVLHRLVPILEDPSTPRDRLYWGNMRYGGKVFEGDKYADVYGAPIYNRYAFGMGFILTRDVCRWLATSSLPFTMFYPEDAYVGLWLAGLHITRKHDTRFHDIPNWSDAYAPCSAQTLVMHLMKDETWQTINQRTGDPC